MIHCETSGNPAFILSFCPAEQIEVPSFAHAEHNQLYILPHNICDDIINQVQAFLIAQPSYHPDDRDIRPDVESEFFLQ